ncbi:MAG: amidohydrolase [Alphaproteobacteria bacterium]|nr:amidohydrolase [Alphaproteobacteria bacterium]
MPDILIITNAQIVTCDKDHHVIASGALVVQAGRICWVGLSDKLPASWRDGAHQLMDADGDIVMPGLINMHAHCGDSLFRGLVEDLPLEAWLNTVWKAEGAILNDPANCHLGASLGFAELLLSGTTTVMDMFWHADQSFGAAREAGIRLASGGIYFDPPGMDGLGSERRDQMAARLFAEYGNDDACFVGTLPHGAYTVGPKALVAAYGLAAENDGFFSIHAAETRAEQETVRASYGKSVIRHLASLGILSKRMVLAHCVHVDDEEIDLIAKSGAHVVHNPLSNLKLGSGFSPVPKMLARGINVTLGTDGPISGNDMDMWLTMRLAATIHKGALEDAAVMPTKQVLHMATLYGARALRAEQHLGSLEVGKRADFIRVDMRGPHASPMFDPITHLVYSAARSDVRDVFVAGRQVVDEGVLLTLDVGDLCARSTALIPQITAALKEAP